MTFAIVFFGWIFSLCLHEFSHALVAYFGGDYTVREKGYLTFNPLKYTHPVFSIVLPLLFLVMGGIGLPGGAVYIERWRIRNRFWLSAMSLAGPFSNLVFALILGLILRFSPVTDSGIWPGVSFLLVLQVSAVLFNLIPLPPFDGYNAIEPFPTPCHPHASGSFPRYGDLDRLAGVLVCPLYRQFVLEHGLHLRHSLGCGLESGHRWPATIPLLGTVTAFDSTGHYIL